ncbi:hypothetical protein GY45DRAFT_1062891 [Cubamyces sp. BRFM 1775]|nr:hypothetical protein GY45DRAFT_1062891 [Cubamyces sp. BRFM 1775]
MPATAWRDSSVTRSATIHLLLLGLLALGPWMTAGALDEPVANSCSDSSYSWSYNSQGQSPCEVTKQMLQPCGQADNGQNKCYCNTVTYSLWAACSLCNGQSPARFATYITDGGCTIMSVFAPSDGVDIPGWTNTPLTSDDSFDVQAAKQEAESVQPSAVSSTAVLQVQEVL